MMNTDFKIDGNLYTICLATKEDTKSIDRLYHDVTIESMIDISFTRGEDPYSSVMSFGDKSKIFVCKNVETNECIACVVLGLYRLSLHGKVEDVFYINGLKILKKYQKTSMIYPRLLKYIYENYGNNMKYGFYNVDKTVEDDKLLYEKRNKKIPYLPICNFQSEIETRIFKPARKDSIGLVVPKKEERAKFYNQFIDKYNLFPVEGIKTIKDEEYLVWKKEGKIVASCALTNQDKYKCYIVKSLKGFFKLLPYLPLHLLGFPNIPPLGTIVKHYNLSMIAFSSNLSLKEKIKFIKSATSYAKDSDMIITASSKQDSSYQALRKIKGIGIPSLIYSSGYEELDYQDYPVFVDITLL